jgi:hypothetical protein
MSLIGNLADSMILHSPICCIVIAAQSMRCRRACSAKKTGTIRMVLEVVLWSSLMVISDLGHQHLVPLNQLACTTCSNKQAQHMRQNLNFPESFSLWDSRCPFVDSDTASMALGQCVHVVGLLEIDIYMFMPKLVI